MTQRKQRWQRCNRNGIYKEKIESAVITALFREFSLLGYPGSIEEEIRKYYDYKNREIVFQLARIDDEVNHIKKRIELTMKEKETSENKRLFSGFIKEMKPELDALEKQKSELSAHKKVPILTNDTILYLRDRIRYFISNLKSEAPEQQHLLLKEFVIVIIPNKLSGCYKLIYRLQVPSETFPGNEIILEKTLYFDPESQ